MVTYFIQCGTNGPIKVGITKCLRSRISGMQSGCPYTLKCIGTLPGDWESDVLGRFHDLRMRGEWFVPGPDLLEYIASRVGQMETP